ncbi:alpha/beta hydrolase-fold protein [Terrimonas pollutisoli]|uniref:alpha/beta hydrolase-fold protein n=1 Tax=Terrimonas pollutisoli TaxID=3034147 RepID=UPI0023ECFFA3|nr:alpha/beta hydrolase-fold protein [Terrimonas sp. H1YJ31]
MNRIAFAILGMFLTAAAMAQHTVQLQIKALPEFHPSGSSIYVAGSFNGWNPRDEGYKFKRDDKGSYYLDLKLDKGSYEYKLTRGGWDKAECKKAGAGIENRLLKVEENTNIQIAIEEWADRFPAVPKESTASKNVQVIDTAFLIPQLKRTRRIWIYLPGCYNSCSKRFPVLYMHDGQNVFDDATSYSGEWGVDEYLDSLGMNANECIVVAIDNGGIRRMNEYCPYDFNLSGPGAPSTSNKGEGNAYVDFIVKTLKPFIDKNYRTVKNKANTAIAGSSMGGLISLYAVLKYPRIFGAVAVFSPAFWVAPKIFDDIKAKGKKVNSKIYFFAGKLEGERMVPDMLKAYEAMSKVSKSKMQAVIRDDGKHNEATWRKEFPLFYNWINTGN